MRCLLCESLSLTHICKSCQTKFLKPSLYKRQLENGITLFSFYKYEEIKELLYTKHTDIGFYIYKILAKNSLKLFGDSFDYERRVALLPIDDTPKSGYSHTAILAKSLKSRLIKPYFAKLRAKNTTSYSGKNRAFRLNNPRNFIYREFKEEELILIDDIVTTGSTLSQAIALLQKHNKKVLFCLTLSDVANKQL